MNAAEFRRVREVFHLAASAPRESRGSVLDSQCGEDHCLRARVEALLAHTVEDEFLSPPSLRSQEHSEPEFRRIGSYLVHGVIATGGMGTIYEASQDRPARKVAVKVLRAGSPSQARRFEFESQVLARLRHPAIAQVYEAGIHHDPRGSIPYFAMELIEGAATITAYAEEHRLDTAARLDLFRRVCEAVHHGHQHGVIHRDLKPANILIDGNGHLKLIDFGIARLAAGDETQRPGAETFAFSGTLAYMAPEQCRAGRPADTTADVYSLGVILYQLLCGELPYDVGSCPLHEACEIIALHPPKRPSAAPRPVRGDLEAIILKALEKDPQRRYQSAAELARDIERYSLRLPVDARPITLRYQVRMFAGRHRAAVAAAGLVVVTLAAGAGVSTWFAVKAERQARRADAARNSAERAAEFLRATLASANPMLPARIVEHIDAGAFDPWGDWRESPWPFAGRPGQTASVVDLLIAAGARLESSFADDPLAHASLADGLGWTLFRLGQQARAEPLLRRAVELHRRELGDDESRTIQSVLHLAEFLQNKAGHHAEAEPQYQRALASCGRAFGPGDARTLAIVRAYSYYLMAHVDRTEEAAALIETSLREAGESRNVDAVPVLETRAHLAFILASGRLRLDEVGPMAERSVRDITELTGARSVHTMRVLENVTNALMDFPAYHERAERWAADALEVRIAQFGSGGYSHAMGLARLASIRDRLGRSSEAAITQREAWMLFRDMYGDAHFETIRAMMLTGQYLLAADTTSEEGLLLMERAAAEMIAFQGYIDGYGRGALARAASVAWDRGERGRAIAGLRSALALLDAPGDTRTSPESVAALSRRLANYLAAEHQPEEARSVLHRAIQYIGTTDRDSPYRHQLDAAIAALPGVRE